MLASGLDTTLPTWAVVLAAVVGFGPVGCDSSSESSGGESESSAETAADGPVVAEAGPLEVTLDEYSGFLERSQLFAPTDGAALREMPEKRKKSPRVQMQTVRTLLKHEAIRQLADRRDLSVTDDEIEAHLRESDKLSRFVAGDGGAGEPELALPDSLSSEELREVARLQLLRSKLRDALLAEMTTDDLWEIYRRRHDTVRIAYVSVPNSPTPDNIDEFLEGLDAEEIETYIDEHSKKYRDPRLVRLALVRPPAGQEVDEETLAEAADALAEGTAAAEVADDLGLEAEPEAQLVRKENREAFGAEQGDTGYQTSGPRGAYAWRVEGWREGSKPEIDRALAREVAADMLSDSVVPSVAEKLAPVLEAMRNLDRDDDGTVPDDELASLEEIVAEKGWTLETPEAFSRANDGEIPGLGLAEEVFEAVFALDRENPVVDEPVLSRDRAVAATLLERQRPDREAFDEHEDEFRETIVEERRARIVDEHVGDWLSERDPDLDLEPIREKYGVVKKGDR